MASMRLSAVGEKPGCSSGAEHTHLQHSYSIRREGKAEGKGKAEGRQRRPREKKETKIICEIWKGKDEVTGKK